MNISANNLSTLVYVRNRIREAIGGNEDVDMGTLLAMLNDIVGDISPGDKEHLDSSENHGVFMRVVEYLDF